MHAHPTRTLLILLAALLIIASIVFALRLSFPAPAQTVEQVPSTTIAAFPADAPAPKAVDYVAAQHGFQYLVSYTDKGFTPKTLSVKKGETVRFTNNSGSTLQLSLSGATPLAHGQYFEYTFASSGASIYSDGTPAHTGTVTVK